MKKTPPAGFNPSVPLPKDLTIGHIARAIEYIERLKNSIVFQHPGIKLVGGKPTPAED